MAQALLNVRALGALEVPDEIEEGVMTLNTRVPVPHVRDLAIQSANLLLDSPQPLAAPAHNCPKRQKREALR
jgi:hypothetical protein